MTCVFSYTTGLVSNLSNSFSKWRKDGKGHNSSSMSDKSAMSFSSIDKSSIVMIGNPDDTDSIVCDYFDPLCPNATPKMMRKRKAEEEMVPFSASKKWAYNLKPMQCLSYCLYQYLQQSWLLSWNTHSIYVHVHAVVVCIVCMSTQTMFVLCWQEGYLTEHATDEYSGWYTIYPNDKERSQLFQLTYMTNHCFLDV